MIPSFPQFNSKTPINHVMVLGQSLGSGSHGTPPLSTARQPNNWTFNLHTGLKVRADWRDQEVSMRRIVNMAETVAVEDSTLGETIMSSFTNWITNKVGMGVHDLFGSNNAVGSSAYTLLSKSGTTVDSVNIVGSNCTVTSDSPFAGAHMLFEDGYVRLVGSAEPLLCGVFKITSINLLDFVIPLATSGGSNLAPTHWRTDIYRNGLNQINKAISFFNPYRFRALLCVHGESDANNQNYDDNIREWQSDYEGDINQITGRSETIPMFHSQQSSNPGSLSQFLTTAEAVLNPTKTLLVCPKYFLTHHTDGIHLNAASYRWLGEYYAKAYYQQIIQGVQWDCVRPSAIVRTGAVIVIDFAGNVGNLVFDYTAVTDPGSDSGFEYSHTGGNTVVISTVALTGPSQVTVTLDDTPTGTTKRIRYAYSGTNNDGGPTTGPRGNLRDSDSEAGVHGANLYNWCVHFDESAE